MDLDKFKPTPIAIGAMVFAGAAYLFAQAKEKETLEKAVSKELDKREKAKKNEQKSK